MMRDPLTAPLLPDSKPLGDWAKGARFSQCAVFLAFALACSGGARAQDHNCKFIPARQEIWIRLTDAVSTYSSKRGDIVRAILIASPECEGTPVLPAGTAVEGRITHIRRVGYGLWHDSSAVTIAFDKILGGSVAVDVRARVEEVANGRENVKAGTIQGVGGRDTPQQLMSTRLLHLPFWNTEGYWIFLVRRGLFPFSPEPETYLPAGTDLRLTLMASVELPDELVEAREQKSQRGDAPIDSDLRNKLFSVPRRTLTRSGKPSDVVNLAFVGSPQQVETAFHAAGWTYGDAVSAGSVLREMRAMSSLTSYPHLPISKQWLAGKPPDVRLQKSFDSYEKREHIRLWNENSLAGDLWVGSVIRETSASWSIRTGRFIHHVDSDLPAEREKVVRDLMMTGCVDSVSHLQQPERAQEEKNATGDQLRSDGEVAIVEFNDCAGPNLTAIPPVAAIRWRPGSKLKRFVRAQALSIHDLWRSNVIYMSFDLSRIVIHSLRHRQSVRYETHAGIDSSAAPHGAN